MRNSSVFDCSIISLPKLEFDFGSTTSVNNLNEVPFEVKRVYYLYDVPG